MVEGQAPRRDVEPPKPSGLDREGIAALAADVTDKVGMRAGMDLDAIIFRAGGQIRTVARTAFALGGPARQATLRVTDPRQFEVCVPDDVGRSKRRALLAHELGHLVLHYPLCQSGDMAAWAFGDSRTEWEASEFAAAFLTPAAEFRQAHADLDGIVVDLAERFGVSTQFARQRCEELGLPLN